MERIRGGLSFGNACLVPVDAVDELPGILIELNFKLAFFVDDQLSGGIENSVAFVCVLIIEILRMETSCSDVEPTLDCFSMYNRNFLNRSVHIGSFIPAEISVATVAFSGKGVVKSHTRAS